MRKLAFLCLLASVFVSSAANARADDESLREPTIRKVHSRYGNQTLLCDMGALGLAVTGLAVGADGHGRADAVLLVSSGSLFLIGGPIVHLAHDHPFRALFDFGLRSVALGVPLALGLPWIASEERRAHGDNEGVAFAAESTAVMIALGFGAMTALDAAVFTRETKNVTVEPNASRSSVILPGFSVARGGATLGVQGAF